MFFKMAKIVETANLANFREQRKNAGNKMSKLLADELGDDEFYKTALGGFVEESGDEEYVSEDEQSDQVDSDFSLSETDEVMEQDFDDEDKKKRKKTFFRSPVRPRSEPKEKLEKAGVKNIATEKAKKQKPTESRQSSCRKSTRATTVQSSDKSSRKTQGKKVYKKQVKFSQHRPLTQKELLAEAKITEQLNIASLEAYQQMEETKKKAKNLRPVRKEPMIRYLSLSMPIMEINEEIKVDDDGLNDNHLEMLTEHDPRETTERKCSRNFIIFTDPKTFPGSYFSTNKISVRQKAYCPVTGLPAKYKDPVTGLPYATGQAFRYIREHYAKQTADANSKPGESRLRSSRRQSQHTETEAT